MSHHYEFAIQSCVLLAARGSFQAVTHRPTRRISLDQFIAAQTDLICCRQVVPGDGREELTGRPVR